MSATARQIGIAADYIHGRAWNDPVLREALVAVLADSEELLRRERAADADEEAFLRENGFDPEEVRAAKERAFARHFCKHRADAAPPPEDG